MKKLFPLFFLACYLILSAGCDDYIFEKKIEINKSQWDYEDIVNFDFVIEDTLKKYDLVLEVEHAEDYGFQNLYVQFHTTYPSGEKETQMVSLELSRKSGIWNGECSGNTCEVEIPLQINAHFKEPGNHSIAVEQYMRKNPLPGIKSMELKIAEHKKQ